MLKYYKIGIVSSYEIQEIIEAESLKKAIEIAELRYYAGCYIEQDDETIYLKPKFYERNLTNDDFEKEEK
jgi:hypothetical protein